MNVRINLLPHREERRKRGRQHFAVLAGLTAALGAAVVGAGYLYVAGLIDTQDQRNAFLKSEIAKLDKEIAEIKKLKDEIAALLARKQIIETLQADRARRPCTCWTSWCGRCPRACTCASSGSAGSRSMCRATRNPMHACPR